MSNRQAGEASLREELARLRSDIDGLIGTVGRMADGAAGALSRDTEGLLSDAGTRAREAYDYALDEGRRTLDAGEETVRAHPFLSLAIAAGVGILIGRLLAPRR
jgi:ElaB/YqjD/DUF883 family membrane-anchored ribosome-binding protein